VEFSAATVAEVKAARPAIGAKELARRVDLRDRPFVTIDPPDARDHDDAVYVEEIDVEEIGVEDRGVEAVGAETAGVEASGGGPASAGKGSIRLWVAIADVSHYVREGSALDAEALYRGNSVYFPDRSIPMLPERLSGDLCSLRPDVDRLALVAELAIDRKGAATRSSFYPAVIRSQAKLNYAQAAGVMEAPDRKAGLAALRASWDEGAGPPDPAWVGQLRLLAKLAKRLMERRFAEGSIDFDLPTGEIVLDEEGMPHDVVESERTMAHRAVEEAMLAANRAVAKALESSGLPAIYRCHEEPSPEKLAELRQLLESFGLVAAKRSGAGRGAREGEPLTPLDISRALLRAAGRPEERLVNLVTLRSMRRACYAAENRGHFALGFERYLHFTSPIRRYADLVVHRRLKQLMEGEAPPAKAARMVERVASRISFRERLAVQAEREMSDIKRCAFMLRHVGEEFDGSISGVARHGIYVTLDAFYVDGLLPLWSMPEYMELDAGQHAFVGRSSGRRYRLGDPLRIRVEEVDIVKGWIRFVLAGEEGQRDGARGGKVRRGRAGSGARPKGGGKGRPGGKGKARRPSGGKGKSAGKAKGRGKGKRGPKAKGGSGGRDEREGERSEKPVSRGAPAKSRPRGRGAPTRGRGRR
jgi:ribonuclease R